MTDKQTYLTFIQNTITRLSNYSFQLRGYLILILGSVGALDLKEIVKVNFWLVIGITTIFAVLDAYYLNKEKSFRELFNQVRQKNEEEIDYCMALVEVPCGLFDTLFSQTIILFYGGLLIAQIIFFQNL